MAKLRAGWKPKGLRFAKAQWLGLLRTPRGDSPSVLSPAHRQRLSHWPSLQSSLLLCFTAILCLAARKIPHPPSGCRKHRNSLWMRRHQKQRGDCGAGGVRGLMASVPGPCWRHPSSQDTTQPALPARLPTASLVCQPQCCQVHDQCYLPTWGSARATRKPSSHPTSSCLSALWRGGGRT